MSFSKETIGRAWNERNQFLKEIAPLRSDLYRFCRSLTNNPWDAEDLVQETLINAYGRLGESHGRGIEDPKSYLFRMAANQWIDWCRRARLPITCEEIPTEPYTMGPVFEIREALMAIIQFLPPKERVSIVLKDVFDYSLQEIAEVLGTSEGAVKSSLSRARTKMKDIKVTNHKIHATSEEDKKIIEAAVAAFNKRDLTAMSQLFLSTASGSAYGCFLETSAEEIRNGSMFYTINMPDGTPQPLPFPKAVCEVVNGEPLFIIWHDENTIDDIFRFEVEDGMLRHFDCYYCCPEVLNEIAEIVGAKANSHGHFYGEL